MNKLELRKYLLSRFLLTLLFVGAAQVVVNLIMRSAFTPKLEELLGFRGMLTGKSLGEAIKVFSTCLTTVFLRLVLGEGSFIDMIAGNQWVIRLFGQESLDTVTAINNSLDNTALGQYASRVVLFGFILIFIWLLPFIIGGIAYSSHVSDKVNEVEKKRVEREKEYERQRNLLLSDITHDIKTPITTIAGFSKALSDGTIAPDQQQEYLDAVYNKSMKVSDLVSLLFEYIKLDSKGYVLNRAPLDFAELVRECVAGVYTELEDKKFDVELDIPEHEITVNADKMQLERAINNILSNTIRHNDEGTKVIVSMKKEMNEAILRISDTGARIDREDAIHIFEPFVRGDKSRTSGSGNGLGLSITKKIVEMHDGRITLIQYNNFEKYKLTKTFEIRLHLC